MESLPLIETPRGEEFPLLDEALLPFHRFVEQLSDLDGWVGEKESPVQMRMEKAAMELPIQFEVETAHESGLALTASPPLYYLETSFMPVFHQLKIILELDNREDSLKSFLT